MASKGGGPAELAPGLEAGSAALEERDREAEAGQSGGSLSHFSPGTDLFTFKFTQRQGSGERRGICHT